MGQVSAPLCPSTVWQSNLTKRITMRNRRWTCQASCRVPGTWTKSPVDVPGILQSAWHVDKIAGGRARHLVECLARGQNRRWTCQASCRVPGTKKSAAQVAHLRCATVALRFGFSTESALALLNGARSGRRAAQSRACTCRARRALPGRRNDRTSLAPCRPVRPRSARD